MTVDEIKVAIERRGYDVRVKHYQASVEFCVRRGEKRVIRSYTLFDLRKVKMPLSDFVDAMLLPFSQERLSMDERARHILVKSVEEFTALLKRRGYDLRVEESTSGKSYVIHCVHGEWCFGENFFLYETVAEVAEVAERLDKYIAPHKRCKTCGEVILRMTSTDVKEAWDFYRSYAVEIMTEEGFAQEVARRVLYGSLRQGSTPADFIDQCIAQASTIIYRSAKVGPESSILRACPTCQSTLSDDSVEEIDDV